MRKGEEKGQRKLEKDKEVQLPRVIGVQKECAVQNKKEQEKGMVNKEDQKRKGGKEVR